MLSFSSPQIGSKTEAEKTAAHVFSEELNSRLDTNIYNEKDIEIIFSEENDLPDEDSFRITVNENSVIFSALSVRGLIFAVGYFLRKCCVRENKIYLLYDISGTYSPDKKIRGHQLGYRQTSNTYDAWGIDEYKRCYLDIMYFGANTCEHIPYENGHSDRNAIMKSDEQELLCEAAKEAEKFGLKVSLWYPNCEKDLETAKENREKLFSKCEKIDYVFPPGGDPGDIPPEELMVRCDEFRKILKKYHHDAEMWPSAQQPHHLPDWGMRFLREMKKKPDFIDGVITGPNAAFRLDILRRYLPQEYPIRLYPDITHNLRCEYPVHSDRDDWHYALAAVNGRECANPRPTEYKRIHSDTRGYVIGSVSYSEGVNDDINKAVWSALDFDPDTPLREILEDYSRLFFPESDWEKTADAIFGLEKNWEGDPEENPCIEHTLKLWEELGEEVPSIKNNWRYVQCLFRARCDAFVRRKIIFENSLIKAAKHCIFSGNTDKAKDILISPLPDVISDLRAKIDEDADKLFKLIGLQLGTKKYHAKNFERGAVLDTVDLPLTDLPWLISRFEKARDMTDNKKASYLRRCFLRNKVERDEYYYSVALDGLCPGGVKQNPGFYMNIQADRPDKNKGDLPTALFKLYDHFSFRLKTGGLKYDTDYILMITYRDTNNTDSTAHTVKINGKVLYKGIPFGGARNQAYERDMLPDGFIAVEYKIPKEFIINGCIDLTIKESINGFEIAELRITKNPYKSDTDGGTQ
ncbi:MAG: hypothetical protein E7573_05250 [Ruminococcaceae bacterium]|nr:hypothetical protein [Oscillospiraceae bacterium]